MLFAACPTCMSYLTAVIWPEEFGTLKSTFTKKGVRVRVSFRVREGSGSVTS